VGSTSTSEKNYGIQPELLTELEEMYERQSCILLAQQLELVKHEPESIKYELAVSCGMGLLLQHIYKCIPQETRDGNTNWQRISGAKSRTDRSRREGEERSGEGRSTSKSDQSFIS